MSKICFAIPILALFLISGVVKSEPAGTNSLSAEVALEEYLQAEKAAKLECIKKLDAARSKALAERDTEKAREIYETKQALLDHDFQNALHPFVRLRNDIKTTKWHNSRKPQRWNRFRSNFKLSNAAGDGGNWAVVDVNAIVSTSGKEFIYVWVFDPQRERASLKRFKYQPDYNQTYVKSR